MSNAISTAASGLTSFSETVRKNARHLLTVFAVISLFVFLPIGSIAPKGGSAVTFTVLDALIGKFPGELGTYSFASGISIMALIVVLAPVVLIAMNYIRSLDGPKSFLACLLPVVSIIADFGAYAYYAVPAVRVGMTTQLKWGIWILVVGQLLTLLFGIMVRDQWKRSQVKIINKKLNLVVRHVIMVIVVVAWLVPIVWLVLTSVGGEKGVNYSHFFPTKGYTLEHFYKLLFETDTVSQFPTWFMNTFVVACFTCLISSFFVLMVAYAMSCMRFPARKTLMNLSVIMNLFPGVLSMIAIYFVMKALNLTNSHIGLILVYSASSGLGYLVCKGFFDTVPEALREAAKLDGASEARVFWQVVIPMSKPIIVYTVINSFLTPWMDFVMASLILNSGLSKNFTVAIGLFNMLKKELINSYFAQFCAGGVLVAIPIGILFVIMQKFYVEGITGGAVKG